MFLFSFSCTGGSLAIRFDRREQSEILDVQERIAVL